MLSEQPLKHIKSRKLNAHFNLCFDHLLTTTTKQVKALFESIKAEEMAIGEYGKLVAGE